MGREIKRVAFDFLWPTGKVWKGFVNPYRSIKCEACDGSGFNPATKQLSDDWYAFDNREARWCDNITQDEVDALIANGRLMDFTHTCNKVPGEGWKKIEPQPIITAEMVNAWNKRGMGHDAINSWICVETRAKRLGIFGQCEYCKGEGEHWFSDEIKKLQEEWEGQEPPAGEGWQVWETVSEGSPISPIFETPEAVERWLVEHEGYSLKAAEAFVKSGWVMSMVVADGKIYKDIESAVLQDKGGEGDT